MSMTTQARAEKFALFVSRVLKTCRRDGMTIADIEKATGVSKSTIYRWAAGETTVEPRISQVLDFCDGLNIPHDAAGRLLGWTEASSDMEPAVARIHQILADPAVDERRKQGIRETLRGLANVVDLRNMETV